MLYLPVARVGENSLFSSDELFILGRKERKKDVEGFNIIWAVKCDTFVTIGHLAFDRSRCIHIKFRLVVKWMSFCS